MAFINFQPALLRSSALSVVLVPIHALVALFVPIQAAPALARPVISPALTYRTPNIAPAETAPAATKRPSKTLSSAPVQRLRVSRQFEPDVNRSCAGRLVISGRMSDVCAELERMSA